MNLALKVAAIVTLLWALFVLGVAQLVAVDGARKALLEPRLVLPTVALFGVAYGVSRLVIRLVDSRRADKIERQ